MVQLLKENPTLFQMSINCFQYLLTNELAEAIAEYSVEHATALQRKGLGLAAGVSCGITVLHPL